MKRTFNLAVIITVVLAMATVAFAVAGATRTAQPTDVPVMVTDRSADVAAATPGSGATASGGKSSPSTTTAGGAKRPASKTSAGSGKKTSSTAGSGTRPKSGSGSSTGGASSGGSSARSDPEDFEVVKPPVRDDDEHESDYNRDSGGSEAGSSSSEGD